jgi:hypothetical protein
MFERLNVGMLNLEQPNVEKPNVRHYWTMDAHSGAASIARLTSISSSPTLRENCSFNLRVEAQKKQPPPRKAPADSAPTSTLYRLENSNLPLRIGVLE